MEEYRMLEISFILRRTIHMGMSKDDDGDILKAVRII
jgi:hypothetical protein